MKNSNHPFFPSLSKEGKTGNFDRINYFYSIKYFCGISILLLTCSTAPEECGIGYIDINGKCYNQGDLDVLQDFIDNSRGDDSTTTITMTLDTDGSGTIEPFELQPQRWNENGRLTMLWLYDDTLSGVIPESIGNLSQLDTLNLAFNQLVGEIPQSIGSLINLNYLYLYRNQLSGTIPDSICNIIPNIPHFWIEYNYFCPPYPDCIPEAEINPQNTSQCP